MTPTTSDPPPLPGPAVGPPAVPRAVPRWVTAGALAVALFVLASFALCVGALAGAGVTATGGGRSYGVDVGDLLPAALPGPVAGPLGVAVVTAVLVGPLAVLVGTVVSAVSLHAAWRGRERVDPRALAAVVNALALLALCAHWGDELWTWVLD